MSIKIQTSYAGEVLEHLLTELTTNNELVERGLIRLVPNVKKSYHIPRLSVDKMLQKRKEQPETSDSKGGINLSEVTLVPQDVMIYLEFNPRALEAFWRKWQPQGNLVFTELPANVQGQFLSAIIAQAQEEIGWQMINGVYGEGENELFSGILTRIMSNSDVIRATTSETSMIKRLRAVRSKIPMTLRRQSNLRILMSQADFDRYDQELTDLHHKGAEETEVNKERFKGIRIEPLVQWPDNVIVATLCSTDLSTNLWGACNLADDTEVLLIDKVSNAGEKYFLKLLMKIDTNIAFGGGVVLLDSRTSPSVEFISVDPSEVIIPVEGGRETVVVQATGAFTLAGTHTGFTVSREEDHVVISAEKNTTGSDRMGTVEVRLTGSSKVAKIELFQGNGE